MNVVFSCGMILIQYFIQMINICFLLIKDVVPSERKEEKQQQQQHMKCVGDFSIAEKGHRVLFLIFNQKYG